MGCCRMSAHGRDSPQHSRSLKDAWEIIMIRAVGGRGRKKKKKKEIKN